VKQTLYAGTQEWLNARNECIGGSDVPTILGTGRFSSPFTLWSEKVGLLERDTTETMQWGNALERAIIQEWGQQVSVLIEHCTNMHIEHPTIPQFKFSPDGFEVDKITGQRVALIEIKNVSSMHSRDWEEGCPDYYLDQVQFGLHCTGLNTAYVVALIGGNRCVWGEVKIDPGWMDRNKSTLLAFHKRVELLEAPELTGHSSEDEAVEASSEAVEGAPETVRMSEDFVEIHDDLQTVKEEIKQLEARKRFLRNKLILGLEGAERGEIPGVPGFYMHQWRERRAYSVKEGRFKVFQYHRPPKNKKVK
jgi:putative phage-type endonuclease